MAFAKLTDACNSSVCMFGFDSYILMLQMRPSHKYYGIMGHSYLYLAKTALGIHNENEKNYMRVSKLQFVSSYNLYFRVNYSFKKKRVLKETD